MTRLLLWLLLLIAPLSAAGAEERVFRLGELAQSAASLQTTRNTTLPELARLGFREGQNLIVEERSGSAAELPGLARELVSAKADAIVAIGADAIRAAVEATSTVPIVMFGSLPTGAPYQDMVARPPPNVTGVVLLVSELDGKRLDLLREAVPGARRFGGLLLPSAPLREASEREMQKVAASAGLEFNAFDAAGPDEYPAAFAAMRAAGVQAVVIMANVNFNRDVAVLARLALEARLPTACEWAQMARAGCLLGYGPSRDELRRRLAHHIAHLFKGRPPRELPIELPTRYEFAVNLKTAKAIGITVPRLTLARADEVIE